MSVPTDRAISDSPAPDSTDLEHLKLLAIFHYIVGGLVMLFGCLGLFYVVFGIFLLVDPEALSRKGEPPPPLLGAALSIMGLVFTLGGWIFGGLMIYSGRCLRAQKKWMFSLIIAAISCLQVPVGTLLGVFTIVVLSRPSVKRLYGIAAPAPKPVQDGW